MKLLFAFLLIFFVYNASARWHVKTEKDVIRYGRICGKELNFTSESLDIYTQWKLHPDKYPSDRQEQCFVTCVLMKMGLFDDRNGLSPNRTLKQLRQGTNDATVSEDTVNYCVLRILNSDDTCRWGWRHALCLEKYGLPIQRSFMRSIN